MCDLFKSENGSEVNVILEVVNDVKASMVAALVAEDDVLPLSCSKKFGYLPPTKERKKEKQEDEGQMAMDQAFF